MRAPGLLSLATNPLGARIRAMLSRIQQFFERRIAGATADGGEHGAAHEHALELATAALLIEMSRADDEVKEVEVSAVAAAIHRAFDLDHEATRELIRMAEQEADRATSLYEFTRLINDHFDSRQKERVVELLWHVAFADGEIDKYEEHLVRRIADLIYVPHLAFIRAKHRAHERWQRSRGPD